MLLQIAYNDNRYDYVKDFMLDGLIDSGKVARFRRSTGWVSIGVDPIRRCTHKSTYNGAEKRACTTTDAV